MVHVVPVQDVERIRRDPRLRVLEGQENRTVFLGMRQDTEELPGGDGKGGNPFRDLRVRQAVAHAIDVEAIRRRTLRGQAIPTGSMWTHFVNGHSPDAERRPPYDRDRARALLAEAGYPDGFSVQLAGVEGNRRVMEVLAYFLGTVGIRAEVLALPSQEFFERMSRGEFGIFYAGRISITGELTNQVVPLLAARDPARGRGLNNPYGILLPEMEQLLDRAEATADDSEREGLLREIARLIDREQAIVPLYLQQGRWALRRDIRLTPRMDRHTIASELVPAAPGR
jgi:peptide/nickel transport system substrate-binding protein